MEIAKLIYFEKATKFEKNPDLCGLLEIYERT